MGEQVKEFSLKRTSSIFSTAFTYGLIYPVYRSDKNRYPNMSFYMVDDTGERQYFNTVNGKIDHRGGHLVSENWEVIRNNEEEKKMQFKVGEVYKSNTTNQVYRYVGKSNDLGFLKFERASGCHIGILDEFTVSYAESVLELQFEGEEKAPEVPVFVKATLDEAITAFKEGNKSDFYMYNPKKGICTPLVKETNILMLTTWTILKKVGE